MGDILLGIVVIVCLLVAAGCLLVLFMCFDGLGEYRGWHWRRSGDPK